VVANVELPPAASDDLVAEARRIFAEELPMWARSG
jgi:hypothetical protein